MAGHPIAPVLSGVKGNYIKSTPEGVSVINPRQVTIMAIMPSSPGGWPSISPGFIRGKGQYHQIHPGGVAVINPLQVTIMSIMQPALGAGHPLAPVLSGVKGNNTESTPEGWPSLIPVRSIVFDFSKVVNHYNKYPDKKIITLNSYSCKQ